MGTPANGSATIQTQTPEFYDAVMGAYNAALQGADADKLDKTFRAMAEIYRLSSQGTVVDRPAAEAAIAKIVSDGSNWDPASFQALSDVINGSGNPFVGNPQAFASGFGQALSLFGTVGSIPEIGVLSPAVGAALQIAGDKAASALTYLSQSGVDLQYLTSSEPDRLDLLGTIAFSQMADVYQKQQAFQSLASDTAIQGSTGVNLDQDLTATLTSLPDSVASLVQTALDQGIDTLQSNQALQQQITQGMIQQISQQIDALNTQQSKLTSQFEQVGQRQQNQQNLAAFNAINQEITGAAAVGGLFIQYVLGDPQAAKAFTGTVAATQQIVQAIAQFSMGVIGPFALAGGLFTGLSALGSLFSSQTDIMAQLQGMLNQISQQIQALASEVNAQLNQVEETQQETLALLVSLAEAIQQNNRDTDSLLNKIQANLTLVLTEELKNEQTNYTNQLVNNINLTQTFLSGLTLPDLSDSDNLNHFETYLEFFYTYALTYSSDSPFAGEPPDTSAGNYGALLSQAVSGRQRIEYMIALLPGVAKFLNLTIPFGVTTENPLCSPVEWVRGTQGYIELLGAFPTVALSVVPNQINTLWNAGTRVRLALVSMASREVLLPAAQYYRAAYLQMLPVIAALLDSWAAAMQDQNPNATNVQYQTPTECHPNLQWNQVPKTPGRHYYDVGGFPAVAGLDQTTSTDVDIYVAYSNDPLDTCSALGLFANIDPTTIDGQIKQRLAAALPDSPNAPLRDVNVGDLCYAITLVRQAQDFQRVQAELSGWLATELTASTDERLSIFEAAGNAAKIVATASLWCATRNPPPDEITDVSNFSILGNRSDIGLWIANYIGSSLQNEISVINSGAWIGQEWYALPLDGPAAMPWSDQLLLSLSLELENNARSIETLSTNTFSIADTNLTGPLVIDEMLRRIAGIANVWNAALDPPVAPSVQSKPYDLASALSQLMTSAQKNFASIRCVRDDRSLENNWWTTQYHDLFAVVTWYPGLTLQGWGGNLITEVPFVPYPSNDGPNLVWESSILQNEVGAEHAPYDAALVALQSLVSAPWALNENACVCFSRSAYLHNTADNTRLEIAYTDVGKPNNVLYAMSPSGWDQFVLLEKSFTTAFNGVVAAAPGRFHSIAGPLRSEFERHKSTIVFPNESDMSFSVQTDLNFDKPDPSVTPTFSGSFGVGDEHTYVNARFQRMTEVIRPLLVGWTITNTSNGNTATFEAHDTVPGPGTVSINLAVVADPDTTGLYDLNLTISLSGVVQAPKVSPAPSSVDFLTVTVGETLTMPLYLTNTGTAPLTIMGCVASGTGFSVTSSSCSSLQPDQQCLIQTAFTPASAATFSGNLEITSNAPDSPLNVPLSGSSLWPPGISVSPTSVDFGLVAFKTTSTQKIAVTNTGKGLLNVAEVVVSNDAFAVSNPFVGTIEPGATGVFTISFTPEFELETYGGEVSIGYNTAGSSAVSTLVIYCSGYTET